MGPALLIWWISTDALLLIDISLKGGRDGGRRMLVLGVEKVCPQQKCDSLSAWPKSLLISFIYVFIY